MEFEKNLGKVLMSFGELQELMESCGDLRKVRVTCRKLKGVFES